MQGALIGRKLVDDRRHTLSGCQTEQYASECRKWIGAGAEHQNAPVCGACPHPWDEAGPDERGFAASGWAHNCEEAALLQLLHPSLQECLTPEVESGVLFVEGRQATVRAWSDLRVGDSSGPRRYAKHRVD
jgi:hypothetical protein